MTEKELGEALNVLYRLEAEAYQTERLAMEANSAGRKYGIPKEFPPLPDYVEPDGPDGKWESIGKVAGYVLVVVLLTVFYDKPGWWNDTRQVLLYIFIGIPLMALFGYVLSRILAAVGKRIDENRYRRFVKEDRKRWEETQHAEDVAKREREMEEDKERIAREGEIRRRIWCKSFDLNELAEDMRNNQLRDLYDRIGMPADYRKLITMRYMSDFFNQGISRKLEGTDGLYYLVRKELRADQFNASLQDISAKLDKILSNQTQLYRDLVRMEAENKEMVRDLEDRVIGLVGVGGYSGDSLGRAIDGNTKVQKHIANCVELQNMAVGIAMHAHYG